MQISAILDFFAQVSDLQTFILDIDGYQPEEPHHAPRMTEEGREGIKPPIVSPADSIGQQ